MKTTLVSLTSIVLAFLLVLPWTFDVDTDARWLATGLRLLSAALLSVLVQSWLRRLWPAPKVPPTAFEQLKQELKRHRV